MIVVTTPTNTIIPLIVYNGSMDADICFRILAQIMAGIETPAPAPIKSASGIRVRYPLFRERRKNIMRPRIAGMITSQF